MGSKLLCVLLLCCPVASQATIVPRLTLDEMVAQSEFIVEGRVLRSWSAWDSGHRFIWTHYEILVTQTLKGRAHRIVTVSEPGGTVDGLTMQIEGSVSFTPGEEAVLFLYRTPIGYLRTRGHDQGKYTTSLDRIKEQVRRRVR